MINIPTATLNIYFSDIDYPFYSQNKEEINKKIKELIKDMVEKKRSETPPDSFSGENKTIDLIDNKKGVKENQNVRDNHRRD